MQSLVDALAEMRRAVGEAVDLAFRSGELRRLDDDEVMALMADAASIVRQSEAIVIATVAEVQERVDAAPHDERPTTRYGCRSMRELVQRTTRSSGRTVGDVLRAARAVQQSIAPSTGEVLEAEYPAMREAAADGVIGLDSLVAVVASLSSAVCAREARAAADRELAASARGIGVDGAPGADADELRLQAQVWATYLDQDGAEPRESRAMRKRGFVLGACRDGLRPFHGNALPEVAGQLELLLHTILNPKGDGPALPCGPTFVDAGTETDRDADPDAPDPAFADTRTHQQKQHDALAMILAAAARSGELPTIGGAAPTLVVSVEAGDLESGHGQAHVDGCDEPVSLAVARQVACVGVIQRVSTDRDGRILGIEVLDRVFAAHQRRAINQRDGGCIIPGCSVPAAWCEIHHAVEHSVGGPTHTDNGVLLCWFHHRTLDSSGWKVRMRNGVPEVRGPSWWDVSMQWRPVTKSPMRLSRALRARSPGG